jgi:hypothetical protein
MDESSKVGSDDFKSHKIKNWHESSQAMGTAHRVAYYFINTYAGKMHLVAHTAANTAMTARFKTIKEDLKEAQSTGKPFPIMQTVIGTRVDYHQITMVQVAEYLIAQLQTEIAA